MKFIVFFDGHYSHLETLILRNRKTNKNYQLFHKLIVGGILFVCFSSVGQIPDSTRGIMVPRKIIGNDTLPHINLPEVPIMAPLKFKNKRRRHRYNKLVRDIKITLPYARLAAHTLNSINDSIQKIEGEKARKAYLNKAEKELFKEFETPLRRLTFSQGRLLIKLIDRETGDTSFDLIKEYKGGFSAFFWQSVARMFGSNLKSEYDEKGDDKLIEYIIYMVDLGLL